MEYAIIAAGEGSRLAAEGVQLPKPLVTVGGQPMIDRLINQYHAAGASAVHVIINERSSELYTYLQRTSYPVELRLIRQTTPSSLHSFHVLLQHYPDIEDCCLATTDTIFRPDEFQGYIKAFLEDETIDALMGVTGYVDDEQPLYVGVEDDRRITAFSDRAVEEPCYVSGGIYCLRKRALEQVSGAIERGQARMRNYQRVLLEAGLIVKAHPFGKIIDVDHISDIEKAEAFISGI
jgi:Predicted sugar nucleotidyltransferases